MTICAPYELIKQPGISRSKRAHCKHLDFRVVQVEQSKRLRGKCLSKVQQEGSFAGTQQIADMSAANLNVFKMRTVWKVGCPAMISCQCD